MPSSMKPIEALEHAVLAVFLAPSFRRPGRPGEVIEKLPAHLRDALKGLTSHEAAIQATPFLGDDRNIEIHSQLQGLMREFDKTLKLAPARIKSYKAD